MEIVVLDGYTLNPGDLKWDGLQKLGNLTVYDRTLPGQVADRIKNAGAVIVNKVVLGRNILERLRALQYIGVSATGVNNVDLETAKSRGIVVTNVKGYGTASVAQHAFSLLLALTNHVELHSLSVREGGWTAAGEWCYKITPLTELHGKTLGLVGLGDIGTAVAAIARSFGMKVLAYRKNPSRGFPEGVEMVPLERLFRDSDVVSLHCPLTPDTEGIINKETLALMKPSALLINTGRGALVREQDLADALDNGTIAGAGMDVLSQEPPSPENPLLKAPHCIITPHNAWATFEARQRLMGLVEQNLSAYLAGTPQNVVT